MSFPYIDLGTRFPKQFSLSKDCLLIYAYVGGFSYRLILKNTEVSLEDSASTVEVELNGDRLLDAVSELALAVNAYSARAHRSTTIVFAVTAKLRYLENRIAEALSALDFADSVTPMPRKELFYRVERELSGTATPTQILFCGEKETSLFSDGREVELPKSRTGGNGFEDYILSFVVNEYEKAAHYYAQVPRLYAIFRAYSYFSREDTRKDRNRIYPLNWEKPALLPTTAEDDMGSPVPYRLLNAEERIKVDRRFRAFYSTPKRGKTHGKAISIAHAATVYEHMVAPIRNETLTSLMLTGAYADFPLLWDFLSSHPQSPEISFVDEATLVFFGMLLAVKARIEHTTLCLIDANGEELLLFGDDESADERKVAFMVTLRRKIPSAEWLRDRPYVPYRMRQRVVRCENGVYAEVEDQINADLKDRFYHKDENGDYILAIHGEPIPGGEGEEPLYESVKLGVTATPDGFAWHVLTSYMEDIT